MTRSETQPHPGAELSQAQLEELATRLRGERHQRTRQVTDLEQQVLVREDCSLVDALEAASLQENRLRAQRLIEQHRQIIYEIDAALHRLTCGKYGVSETTGQPIAYERLSAIPWARTAGDNKADYEEDAG